MLVLWGVKQYLCVLEQQKSLVVGDGFKEYDFIGDFELLREVSQFFLVLDVFNDSWVPTACNNKNCILVLKLDAGLFLVPFHEVGACLKSEWDILFPLVPVEGCQKACGLGDLASEKVLDRAVEVGALIENFEVDGWVKDLWEMLRDPSALFLR